MLIKTIKLLLCLITATMALNAQAVFLAELDETDYEWLGRTGSTGISHMQVEEKLTDETATLYEYQYTARELEQDLSHSYAPWYGPNEWHSGDSAVSGARVTTSVEVNRNSSPSVKVFLLIISGLIGIFGLTNDRSQL